MMTWSDKKRLSVFIRVDKGNINRQTLSSTFEKTRLIKAKSKRVCFNITAISHRTQVSFAQDKTPVLRSFAQGPQLLSAYPCTTPARDWSSCGKVFSRHQISHCQSSTSWAWVRMTRCWCFALVRIPLWWRTPRCLCGQAKAMNSLEASRIQYFHDLEWLL